MKKLLLPILFCLTVFSAKAQKDPIFAQYINNPMVINPGYTGINNVLNASLSYRTQWAGLDGAPNTASFAAHSSFFDDLVGLGMIVVRDKIGTTTTTQFSLAGAYNIEFNETKFSFGMQAGVNSLKESNSELNPYSPNDPLFNGDQTFSKFNIGAGIVLKSPKYYLGLSVPRLLNNTEDLGMLSSNLYQRHFYFGAGYFINLNSELGLKPAILLKGVSEAPISVDYNVNLVISDRYSAGIITRNFKTYGLLAQLNLNHNLRIGYSIEVPTNNSVGTQYTSHEISITLDAEVFDFHFLDERQF